LRTSLHSASRPRGTAAALPALSLLTALEHLDLSRNELKCEASSTSNNLLRPLAALTALRTLHLEHNWLRDAGLGSLTSCQRLRDLHLGAAALTDGDIADLATLTSLQSLRLTGPAVRGAIGSALSHLQALTRLDLSYCFDEPEDCDEALKSVVQIPSLRALHLEQALCGSLAAMTALTALTHLNLQHSAVDDDLLEDVVKLSSLQHLQIADSDGEDVTHAGVVLLQRLPALRRLEMTLCELDYGTVSDFMAFPQLQTLVMGYQIPSTAWARYFYDMAAGPSLQTVLSMLRAHGVDALERLRE
jgi:hypothetical protein